MTQLSHYNALLKGQKKLGILGLGFLGYSNVVRYIRHGINCVVTDFSDDRRNAFEAGSYPPRNRFKFWQMFSEVQELSGQSLYENVPPEQFVRDDIDVYLVCVPFDFTSSSGNTLLQKAVRLLSDGKGEKVVIFEQTLPPYTMSGSVKPQFENLGISVGDDFSLVYAPRPDWNMEQAQDGAAARNFALQGGAASQDVATILSLHGGDVRQGGSFESVEMAQCLGFAANHALNSVVAQCIVAYDDIDVRDAMNLSLGHLGLDIQPINGGFEAPLGTSYLLTAAKSPQYLTLLQESMSTYFSMQQHLIEQVKSAGCRKVAILGLLPHEHTVEQEASPILELPQLLGSEGVEVLVHDPLMASDRVDQLTGCARLEFPADLENVDAILVLSGHAAYAMLPERKLQDLLRNCRLVLDSSGIWKRYDFSTLEGLEYRVVGEAN